MRLFSTWGTTLLLILFSAHASADDFKLQDLGGGDVKSVVGELSTNFLHTSVSGASTLGRIFGFEIGVVGGETHTPRINDLVKETDSSASLDNVYDAALLGVLTVPLGLTAEVNLLPDLGSSDFHFSNTSVAVKWTPTDVIFDWPLSAALKASFTQTNLHAKQNVNGDDINYKYGGSETALMALVSKNFVVVEPYFGLGLVSTHGELSADASSVFSNGARSMSANRSGTMWMLGAELKLLVVKVGVEYTNLFDTSRVMGKLSLYF